MRVGLVSKRNQFSMGRYVKRRETMADVLDHMKDWFSYGAGFGKERRLFWVWQIWQV